MESILVIPSYKIIIHECILWKSDISEKRAPPIDLLSSAASSVDWKSVTDIAKDLGLLSILGKYVHDTLLKSRLNRLLNTNQSKEEKREIAKEQLEIRKRELHKEAKRKRKKELKRFNNNKELKKSKKK